MQKENIYLRWLAEKTPTSWWNDSALLDDIANAASNGAMGVTTNPLLVKRALYHPARPWADLLKSLPKSLSGEEKAEELCRMMILKISETQMPLFRKTEGKHGWICAQVNPRLQGDREGMLAMARRIHAWAPNIAVKLPVTSAGLDVLEECAAEGISATGTVSFSVPQAVAVARHFRAGLKRARKNGIKDCRGFAVISVGRADNYLTDVALDNHANVEASDLTVCGTAMMKNAFRIFKEEKYEAELMPAGMNSAQHIVDLSGADNMVLSIPPRIQDMLAELRGDFAPQIDKPVDPAVLKRLFTMPEFKRAYEPDGMKESEFIAMGSTQRTLSQYYDAGWLNIEEYV